VALLSRLSELAISGYPVLVGLSRKSTIGALTGREVEGRLAGTIAAHAWCLLQGAAILRVHDVDEAVDTVKIIKALAEGAKK
jgi:dihydropteroate synthase